MTEKKAPSGESEGKLPVSAGTFPALRRFFRGYLHEDWQEEHDSAAEAGEQFCEDATAEERQDVAREWEEFRQRTKNLSLPALSALLNTHLGAAWDPKTEEQIEALSAVFRPFDRKM